MERFYTYRDHTGDSAGFKLAKTAIEIAKVTKAMTLLRVAKIKDKAETLYLNALYAKDAIVKAASTAATWAQTAATTAWNVVCTAATAVTTALGAAFTFLTSPIGIQSIQLCIKCDEVSTLILCEAVPLSGL